MKNFKRSFAVVCDRPTETIRSADYIFHEANVNLRNGNFSAALEGYGQALRIDATHVGSRFNRAYTLAAWGRHEAAVEEYLAVTKLKPDFPGLWVNLGVSLSFLDRLIEAADAFREATRRQPELTVAWNNLGGVLGRLERFEEAVPVLCEAVRLSPGDVEALLNLSRALHRVKSPDAVSIAQQAVELAPNRSEPWVAFGDALLFFEKPDKALGAYQRALSIDPQCLDNSVNLGLTYLQSSKLDEARDFFAGYLKRHPEDYDAWADLAIVLATGGFLDESIDCFRKAMHLRPQAPEIHSNLMVIMSYGIDATPAAMLAEAQNWVRHNATSTRPFPPALPRKHTNLRVGYVSGDFRHHPVGRFVEEIVGLHDRSRFEIYAYSTYRGSDTITRKVEKAVDGWRNVCDATDEELAVQIREDGIDLLIDLSGHTPWNRLPAFGRRLAPVQATWLGYFGTTALAEMDYILADEILLPESDEAFYTERPARMPNGLYYLQKPNVALEPGLPPVLARGYATFGCFNMVSKITPETIALWSEVLRTVPDARMILNRHAFEAKSVRERYRTLFAVQGIDPERIEMRATQSREAYFGAYHDVDVMLDTIPFGGGTTSSEALWMGVPVVSLSSDRFPGRMTESILNTVGLPELVPSSPQEYVQLAVDLVSDHPRLTGLRTGLRAKVEGSRLCDAQAYTRELEGLFEWMWENRRERS